MRESSLQYCLAVTVATAVPRAVVQKFEVLKICNGVKNIHANLLSMSSVHRVHVLDFLMRSLLLL